MPDPGIDPTTFRLRDLRLARLSEPGILCVSVWVCVTPNHFNDIQSVCYHTSPLYSIVCTAAMFGFSRLGCVCAKVTIPFMLKLQGSKIVRS